MAAPHRRQFHWLPYPVEIGNLYSRWGEQIPTIKLDNLQPTQVDTMEVFLKDAAAEKTRWAIFELEHRGTDLKERPFAIL